MKLSSRLQAVADSVSRDLIIADIGTDHGYIPIYLVENDICKKAFAMDINEGPIERATSHIKESGLEDKIEARISNGFEKLKPAEANGAVIAGMGGELMVTILKNGKDVVDSLQEMVLSPHSEINLVRKYLHEIGFKIINEKMLIDEGKFYTIIKAVKGEDKKYSEAEYNYGAILIEKKNVILKEFLENKLHKLEKIELGLNKQQTENAKNRLNELDCEIKEIKTILGDW